MRRLHRAGQLPGKIVAACIVLAFVVIGMIGIVLPVIPGLVFLALAALVAARHVPWIDARLRRHHAFGPRMHRVDRFFRLRFVDQVRVAALLSVKCTLDVLDRVGAWLARRATGSRMRST